MGILVAKRNRVFGFAGALALCVAASVACGSGELPSGSATRQQGSSNSDPCALPNEGCACSAGADAECGFKVAGNDNFIWCAAGVRRCKGSVWGTCEATGQMSVQSRALTNASLGGVGTKAFGTPTPCGVLNPCDPNCRVTTDSPVGIDAGIGFRVTAGGLTVAGGCGDGAIQSGEECDDGNAASGDGCSSACLLETGYQCLVPGAPCTAATCGNGTVEGAERCDDGNLRPYDGCSNTCQREVSCPTGECVAVCGDGIKFPGEACDDGNTANGDGCSSACAVESGATCTTVTSVLAPTLDLPIIYRDLTPATNPDFQPTTYTVGVRPGIVQNTLAPDRAPAFASSQTSVTSAATFFDFFHDSPNNRTILSSLTLNRQPDSSYVFASNNFFPINGLGFGNYAATGKNFHFTSEVRYPFTFNGGEVLSFNGDDDVFVFINGRLAVDLGGLHGPAGGSVTLNAANALLLGLLPGRTYEVSVFQAERNTTGSNYSLTLRGFERARSVCGTPSSTTFVRDFQGECAPGHSVAWQVFRWRASVPPTSGIEFRGATSETVAGLPATAAPAPATVTIGSATNANSPVSATPAWQNAPGPVPVSQRLRDDAGTASKKWLRVYMTFNVTGGSPRLDEWQQLYDCVPNE